MMDFVNSSQAKRRKAPSGQLKILGKPSGKAERKIKDL